MSNFDWHQQQVICRASISATCFQTLPRRDFDEGMGMGDIQRRLVPLVHASGVVVVESLQQKVAW